MIDEEATLKRFGYYSNALGKYSRKSIIAICDKCGKARKIRKCNYRYICRNCSAKVKNYEKQRVLRLECICEECGKIFYKTVSRVNRGNGKYCSKVCMIKGKNKKICRTCPVCEKRFYVKSSIVKRGAGIFCSYKCRDIARLKKVERICEICGKTFFVKPSALKYYKSSFCSKKCSGQAHSGINHPNWQGGKSYEPYCNKFNRPFKDYIRKKFNNKCFLCGKTKEENKVALSVHHVNHNKQCGCDGDETCQFIPLCKSCHTKVHNRNHIELEEKIKNKLKETISGWYI